MPIYSCLKKSYIKFAFAAETLQIFQHINSADC